MRAAAWFLAFANAVALAAIVQQLRLDFAVELPTAAVGAAEPAGRLLTEAPAPDLMPDTPPDLQLGRLFEPPAKADPPAAAAAKPATAEDLIPPTILGILSGGSTETFGAVLLQAGPAGRIDRIRLGQQAGGWKLVAVRRTEADFESPLGERQTLSLAAASKRK